jgi:transcription antitermination protein NusB
MAHPPLRRKARSCAVQMLFYWEMNPRRPLQIVDAFWRIGTADDATRYFANYDFFGAVAHAERSDRLIARFARRSGGEGIAPIDRAILRLAIWEIYSDTAPPNVVISESLRLAENFSLQSSARFLNGILEAMIPAIQAEAQAEAEGTAKAKAEAEATARARANAEARSRAKPKGKEKSAGSS